MWQLMKVQQSFDTKVLNDQGTQVDPSQDLFCGIFNEYKDVLRGADRSVGGALQCFNVRWN